MFGRSLFQSFFLYTGSAILFYHLLNSIHVPPLPFSIFFPIYRFCHPVLPSFKQYTCCAAPFFNIFSYIQVLPSCFNISNIVYMFSRPLFQYYTCSTAPFFLYTGSAILFYHLLNSIHVPPSPFFNLFSHIQVLPSCFNISNIVYLFHRPLFSYIQVLPSCFTIF